MASDDDANTTETPHGMTKSEHADVPDWESCCATPEPYWQALLERLETPEE